jgi:hypothetical protein
VLRLPQALVVAVVLIPYVVVFALLAPHLALEIMHVDAGLADYLILSSTSWSADPVLTHQSDPAGHGVTIWRGIDANGLFSATGQHKAVPAGWSGSAFAGWWCYQS